MLTSRIQQQQLYWVSEGISISPSVSFGIQLERERDELLSSSSSQPLLILDD